MAACGNNFVKPRSGRAGRSGMPFQDIPSPAHERGAGRRYGLARSRLRELSQLTLNGNPPPRRTAIPAPAVSPPHPQTALGSRRRARPGSTSNQSPPARDALSGDTPVRNFVQTAGVKTVGKDDAVIRNLVISWKIDRFVVAFNQTGIKIISKTAIEDLNQLFVMVCVLFISSSPTR